MKNLIEELERLDALATEGPFTAEFTSGEYSEGNVIHKESGELVAILVGQNFAASFKDYKVRACNELTALILNHRKTILAILRAAEGMAQAASDLSSEFQRGDGNWNDEVDARVRLDSALITYAKAP